MSNKGLVSFSPSLYPDANSFAWSSGQSTVLMYCYAAVLIFYHIHRFMMVKRKGNFFKIRTGLQRKLKIWGAIGGSRFVHRKKTSDSWCSLSFSILVMILVTTLIPDLSVPQALWDAFLTSVTSHSILGWYSICFRTLASRPVWNLDAWWYTSCAFCRIPREVLVWCSWSRIHFWLWNYKWRS